MQHDAAMRFRHEVSYDAPLGDVYAMLADPAFREQAARDNGVISVEVSVTPRGEGMSVRVQRIEPTEGVPGFAKKFAGETTEAVQLEEWDSPAGGTIAIKTPGKPTQLTGTLSLRQEEGRTVETMEAEVNVKVPLIGGKLESLMAGLVTQGMDNEQSTGTRWLEERA